MWFIGVEVEQETSAAPPKKNPGSALDYGGLICFLATSSSFLCAGTLSPRGKCCNFFARGLIGVDKHLFQRVSRITSMTLPLNYIFVLLLANVDVIPKQKQLSTV